MDIAQLQQQAAEYLEQGQHSEAIALYQRCIDNPTLMSNYWQIGLALLLKGEELEAQSVWLLALTQYPQEIDVGLAELLKVLEAAAIRYFQFGNMHLAEIIYWQILELDSDQAEAHYHLGTAIAHRGDLDAAVACWQRAVELKPDFPDAYQNQGYAVQKQGRFEEAIPCYLKALEIQPDWTETHYSLGICFSQQGRLDEAIACFQKAIQLKPNYMQAYSDWGSALLEQGKLDEAIDCFQKAIQLKPSFAQAYCNWRDTLLEQGKSDEAIASNAYLLKVLQIQSKSAEVYLYLGKALAREKKFDRAIALYRKALQMQPHSDTIYFDLGKALAQQENLSEAVASYQEAIQIQAVPSAEVYFYLGKALVQQGNLTEAIISYQKVIEINPTSADVYFDLGNALGSSGQLDEAIAFYQKALEINPNLAEAYCNLGIALAQRDNSDAAIACFQKVMEINPNLAKLIYDVMINLCRQDKLDEAAVGFQKVLPVTPPSEFYESTWDWAVTHKLDTSNYISIYPKNQIDLTPPITIDKAVDFAFRFGTKVDLPATFVAIVPDGRYWLNQYQDQTAIITSDNKLLADVSPDFPVLSPGHPDKHPSKHLIFSLEKLPSVQSIDGTVVILSGLLNDVYFHWMFDILPRIRLVRKFATPSGPGFGQR